MSILKTINLTTKDNLELKWSFNLILWSKSNLGSIYMSTIKLMLPLMLSFRFAL